MARCSSFILCLTPTFQAASNKGDSSFRAWILPSSFRDKILHWSRDIKPALFPRKQVWQPKQPFPGGRKDSGLFRIALKNIAAISHLDNGKIILFCIIGQVFKYLSQNHSLYSSTCWTCMEHKRNGCYWSPEQWKVPCPRHILRGLVFKLPLLFNGGEEHWQTVELRELRKLPYSKAHKLSDVDGKSSKLDWSLKFL